MVKPWDAGMPVEARGRFYVACAANGTTILQQSVGAVGDELDWLWLFPATTTPAATALKDGATTVWTFPAVALTDIRPIFVPLNLRSLVGAWSLVAGANMAGLGAGSFS